MVPATPLSFQARAIYDADWPLGLNNQDKNPKNTTKKLLLLTALGCAFAAQSVTVLADATTAQKDQIEKARKEVVEAVKTEDGCKAMCEEMMKHKSSKKMMCEMMAKDPEAMKMMKDK